MGDPKDKASGDERRRRKGREPTVLDLKAEPAETPPAPPEQTPSVEPDPIPAPPHETMPASAEMAASAHDPFIPAEVPAEPVPEPAEGAAVAPTHEPADAEASAARLPGEEPTTPEAEAALAAMEGHDTTARAPEPEPSPEPSVSPATAAMASVAGARQQRSGSGLGPVLLGLVGGFVGAGLVVGGLMLVGPLNDMNERLAGLENAVGERAPRRTVETMEKKVATLEGGAATQRSDLDALAKRVQAIPSNEIGEMLGRVDRLERNVADLAAQPAARPAAEASPAATPPPPPPPPLVAARESAVLAIALLLRDSLNRGLPYARELDALQSAGVDSARIEALKPFAASGAPGAAALAAQFGPLAEKITNPPPPSANTLTDRISATVNGLFKVRPVGEATGDAPPALAARTEALLKRGALRDASATLDKVPAADIGPAASFRDTLHARVAADDATAAILSKAVDELLAAARLQGATTR
ncbi:MAG: hypothetical protein U1E62_17820 [Alsobacter sp.]